MRIFLRDLKYQIKKFKIALFCLVLVYMFIIYLSNHNRDISMMEGFFYYAYFDSGIIVDLRDMTIPDRWLLLHLIPSIGLLVIFIKDHYENGIYTLMKVETKTKYFFSKILASVVINIGAIFVFAIPFFICAKLKNNDSKLLILFIKLMMCLVLENILLTMILILIALVSSTMIAIFIAIFNMVFSMSTNIKYLIGQSSLAYKQKEMGGILEFSNNILFLFLLIILIGIISYIYFYRYNYYGDEK